MKPVIDTSDPDIETLDVSALRSRRPKNTSNASIGIYRNERLLFTRKELIITYRCHSKI